MEKKGVGVKLVQKERFTFRIPKKLLDALKGEAEEVGVSVNALILNILWDWAKQNGLLDTDAS